MPIFDRWLSSRSTLRQAISSVPARALALGLVACGLVLGSMPQIAGATGFVGSPNQVTGTVWGDEDCSGGLNGAEVGSAGVTVWLYEDVDTDGLLDVDIDTPAAEAEVTAADGSFTFEVSATGSFLVALDAQTLPAGHSPTAGQLHAAVFSGPGESDTGNDFGHHDGCTSRADAAIVLARSGGGAIDYGDDVSFDLDLTNQGDTDLTNIVLSVDLPANTTVDSASSGYTIFAHPTLGDQLQWTIPSLTAASPPVTVNFTLDTTALTPADAPHGSFLVGAQIMSMTETDDDSLPGNMSPGSASAFEDDEMHLAVDVNQPDDNDLALDLLIDEATTVPQGTNVGYSIVVTNEGNRTQTGIVVRDDVDATLDILHTAGGDGVSVTGQQVDWTIDALLPGASTTLQLTLGTATTPPGTLQNCASILAADQVDGDSTPGAVVACPTVPEDDEDAIALVVETPVIDLEIDVETDPATSDPTSIGTDVTYNVVVTNTGNASATTVVAAHQVPVGMTFDSATDGGALNSGRVEWTIPSVAAGASISLAATYSTAGATAGSWSSCGEIVSMVETDADSTPGNLSGCTPAEDDEDDAAINLVDPRTDVAVSASRSDGFGEVPIGDEIDFTIVVTNEGDLELTNVEVTDTFPVGATFVSASDSPAVTATDATWTIPSLPAGSSRNLTLTVDTDALSPGALSNCVEVTSLTETDDDSTPGNMAGCSPAEDDEAATSVTMANASPDVALHVSSDVDAANPGSAVTFTVVVSNPGNAALSGIAVQNALPTDVDYLASSGGGIEIAPGVVEWSGLAIPAGDSLSFVIDASVNVAAGDAVVENCAEVTALDQTDIDSTPANLAACTPAEDDESRVELELTSSIVTDLELTQTAVGGATVEVGEDVTLVLSVENRGTSTVTNSVISSELPLGLLYVSSDNSGSESAGVVTWTIDTIEPGDTFDLQVVLDASAATPGGVANCAEVASMTPASDVDSTPGNFAGCVEAEDDESRLDLTIIAASSNQHDVALDLAVNQATVTIGDDLIATVTVTNEGPADLTDLDVVTSIPAGAAVTNTAGPGSASAGASDVSWNLPLLGSGSTAVLVITYDTTGMTPTVASVCAEVAASGTPDDTDSSEGNLASCTPSEDDEDATSVNFIDGTYDVELSVSGPAGTIAVGGEATFQFTVTNAGAAALSNIVVRSELPGGTTFSSATAGGAESAGTVTWTIASIAPAASQLVSLTIDTDALGAGSLELCGEIASSSTPDDTDSTEGNLVDCVVTEDDEDAVTVTIEEIGGDVADISLVGSVVNNNVTPSTNVTFSFLIANQGTVPLTGIVVRDELPLGMSFLSATEGGTALGQSVTWNLATLAPGANRTLQVTVDTAGLPIGNIDNCAQVLSMSQVDHDSTPGTMVGCEPIEDDETRTTLTLVDPGAPRWDVELTMSAEHQTIARAVPINLTVEVANNGNRDLLGVDVEQVLPSGFTVVATEPAADVAGVSLTWEISVLAPGETVTFEVEADSGDAGLGDHVLCAQVTSADTPDTYDSTEGNLGLTCEAAEDDEAGLTISLVDTISIGDRVFDDLDGDGVQDLGEPGISGVAVLLLDGTGEHVLFQATSDFLGSYNFLGLPPDQYLVEVHVPAGATLSPADAGTDDTIDSDFVTSDVCQLTPVNGCARSPLLNPVSPIGDLDVGLVVPQIDRPDLTISIGAASSTTTDGSTVAWDVRIANEGAGTAAGPIVVTDSLPSELSYVSATGTGWTCAVLGQVVTCTYDASIAGGAAAPTLTLLTRVNAPEGTTITNHVSVQGSSAEATVGNNGGSTNVVVQPGLARTGASSRLMTSLAALLISLGVAMLVLSRRARPALVPARVRV